MVWPHTRLIRPLSLEFRTGAPHWETVSLDVVPHRTEVFLRPGYDAIHLLCAPRNVGVQSEMNEEE